MKAATTLLVFCVGALLSLGFVMLYSAGLLKGGAHYLLMQLMWAVAGLTLAAIVAGLDYAWLKKAAWPLLVISIALLGLVLVYGTKTNGARRWFHLGVANFQPSEMAKLALIITLAFYGDRYQRYMGSFHRGVQGGPGSPTAHYHGVQDVNARPGQCTEQVVQQGWSAAR